jgi:hypothetical protein
MSGVSNFVSSIPDTFIQLCLVELALSFLRACGTDGLYHKIIRYFNFFAVAILLVLAIAALGADQDWMTKSDYGIHGIRGHHGNLGHHRNNYVSWTNAGNLYGAYYILFWIISLATVSLSAFVLYSSMRKKRLQGVSKALYTRSVPSSILLVFPLTSFSLFQIFT